MASVEPHGGVGVIRTMLKTTKSHNCQFRLSAVQVLTCGIISCFLISIMLCGCVQYGARFENSHGPKNSRSQSLVRLTVSSIDRCSEGVVLDCVAAAPSWHVQYAVQDTVIELVHGDSETRNLVFGRGVVLDKDREWFTGHKQKEDGSYECYFRVVLFSNVPAGSKIIDIAELELAIDNSMKKLIDKQ